MYRFWRVALIAVGMMFSSALAAIEPIVAPNAFAASGPTVVPIGVSLAAPGGTVEGTSLSALSCPQELWCGGADLDSSQNDSLLFSGPTADWAAVAAPFPTGAVTNTNASQVWNVVCPAVGSCTATGSYHDTAKNSYEPLLYQLSAGTWTASDPAPPSGGTGGGGLSPLSCPSVSWCAAGGYFYASGGRILPWAEILDPAGPKAMAVPLPADAATNPSSQLSGLVCAGSGVCTATTIYANTSGSLSLAVLTLSGGSWTAAEVSPPAQNGSQMQLGQLACPTTTWCAFTGTYRNASGYAAGFIDTVSNGTTASFATPLPSDAPASPTYNQTMSGLSCPAAGWCEALGYYQYESNNGNTIGTNNEAVTLSSGQLTALTLPNDPGYINNTPGSISCPATNDCTATAESAKDNSGYPYNALLLSFNSGSWTYLIPPGLALQGSLDPEASSDAIGDLNCPASNWCVSTGGSSTSQLPFIEDIQYGGTPTSVSVVSSSNPGTVNVPVTYSATVSPAPDAGVVAFFDYGSPIPGCSARPVDPSTGQATCSISYTSATTNPGNPGHEVNVSYLGDNAYAESGPSSQLSESVQSPPPCPSGVTHLASGEPWAVAAMTATTNGQTCGGYWVVTRSGGVTAIGAAPWLGDMSGHALNAAMIGIASTPTGKGYYLLGADGGIFTYGDAVFHGSTGSMRLNAPVVAMAVTPGGDGYWLAASDGGIFTFGNASFYGSMGGKHLNQPVVGMSADSHAGGYWLVAADGGIFTFGNAPFYGSMGSHHLNQPVVGMSPQPDGGGYRLVAADGGVFDYGDATFYGSLPGQGVQNPQVTTMATSIDGNGYYLINGAGTVWAFGDAPYLGNA